MRLMTLELSKVGEYKRSQEEGKKEEELCISVSWLSLFNGVLSVSLPLFFG